MLGLYNGPNFIPTANSNTIVAIQVGTQESKTRLESWEKRRIKRKKKNEAGREDAMLYGRKNMSHWGSIAAGGGETQRDCVLREYFLFI